MTDETWHLVKNTSKVTGFIGGKSQGRPRSPQHEVEKIMQQMQEGIEKPRPKVLYEVGELVRIKEGPFTDFNGNVEEVNYEKSRVRVSVTIFGRATPVELEFGQVEKVCNADSYGERRSCAQLRISERHDVAEEPVVVSSEAR